METIKPCLNKVVKSEDETLSDSKRSYEVFNTFLIETRRKIHQNAESGWLEFQTTALVAERLKELGYEVKLGSEIVNLDFVMGRPSDKIVSEAIERAEANGVAKSILDKMDGYTGALGILDTGREGPTTVLRFDIDANDISERQLGSHKPYREGFASKNPLAMHACGHDGHTAIGLAVAETLMQRKSCLKGIVKLVFQPAEEGVRGAKAIVESGVVDEADYFIAGHIGFGVPKGGFTANTTQFLATTKMDVVMRGKASHAGAKPEEGTNALLAAAAATVQLHTITQHSAGLGRLNVGTLRAGTGRNIIADYAKMQIEARGETTEVNGYIVKRAEEIIRGTASAYGVEVSIEKVGEAVTSYSDGELADRIHQIASKCEADLIIYPEFKLGGSEDATVFMERVRERGGKAAYMIMGSEIAAGHHNEAFDFDEGVLVLGLKLFTEVVMDLNG